jgi:hypothetical protein
MFSQIYLNYKLKTNGMAVGSRKMTVESGNFRKFKLDIFEDYSFGAPTCEFEN